MAEQDSLDSALLGHRAPRRRPRLLPSAAVLLLAATLVGLLLLFSAGSDTGGTAGVGALGGGDGKESIEAEHGVVAADDWRCSEIGASALRAGGHAVDAAVATALCLGVVNPMSSGLGGGAFMVVRDSAASEAWAFDSRETAPSAASKDMYANNPSAKTKGPLSAGVPGELAGLHAAWSKYGRLPWRSLFQPSIQLARDGFSVSSYLAHGIKETEDDIRGDPGLRRVFVAPDGKLLREGDTCRNIELSRALEVMSIEGPEAFYNGSLGRAFIRDVRDAGGILTEDDLREYRVEVTAAMAADVMGGYSVIGMPPPSSGTVGMSLVLNILGSYGSPDAASGPLGLHRFIEAMKYMFSVRMDLGDPDFVNVKGYVSEMLSHSFAEKLRRRILDNTTFGPDHYLAKWSQLRDHGTSHFCVVDADRNAVSMTSTVNRFFGASVMSPSTGIVLNDEMDDFSTPAEVSPDKLPPSPANFIAPKKRPLSSMTPIIVLKGNQLAGVIGGSGGFNIIPAVAQIFLNHFIQGMEPLAAVREPRVYHKLIPDVVSYENLTAAMDGAHIELSAEYRTFLERRGHHLEGVGVRAVCQLVVQDLQNPIRSRAGGRGTMRYRGLRGDVFRGMLTAVSDPRKNGLPAGV